MKELTVRINGKDYYCDYKVAGSLFSKLYYGSMVDGKYFHFSIEVDNSGHIKKYHPQDHEFILEVYQAIKENEDDN